MPWHNYRGFLRAERKANACSQARRKPGTLESFLDDQDPGLRAEIISTVKKTASGQTKK